MFLSIGLLLLAMLSIQFGATQAKQLFHELSPAVITMIRTALATGFMFAVFRPWRTPLSRSAWGRVAVYGITLGVMNLVFYFALQRIPLGVAVALEFVGPLGVALYGTRRWVDLIWVILAGVGIYMLVPWSGVTTGLDPLGVLLALGAGFCWGCYIIFGKRIGTDVTSGQASAFGMMFAALTVLPFGAWSFKSSVMTPRLWLLGAMVALLSSAIPYALEMIVMRRMNARTFGILMSIEPALATLMGLVFLHESLDGFQTLALVAIVSACLGSSLTAP
ncbi:MAG: DMT family transporter, partial [Bdellovibrionota bacterium]